MDSWYYIDGSQQMGPISETMLLGLFNKNEISLETYVWKKGFPEWLRFKNVSELNDKNTQEDDFFEEDNHKHLAESETANLEEIEDFDLGGSEYFDAQDSLDMMPGEDDFDLDFSWKLITDKEEVFFIKIGRDRHEKYSRIFGPYTLEELKYAYEQKRINSETLLIAPGMKSWVKIHNTPINELFFDNDNKIMELEELPVIFLVNTGEYDLIGIVKDVKYPNFKLSCSKDMSDLKGKDLRASLYLGNELKFKNISVVINDVDLFLQEANCEHVDNEDQVRNLLLKSDL